MMYTVSDHYKWNNVLPREVWKDIPEGVPIIVRGFFNTSPLMIHPQVCLLDSALGLPIVVGEPACADSCYSPDGFREFHITGWKEVSDV